MSKSTIRSHNKILIMATSRVSLISGATAAPAAPRHLALDLTSARALSPSNRSRSVKPTFRCGSTMDGQLLTSCATRDLGPGNLLGIS